MAPSSIPGPLSSPSPPSLVTAQAAFKACNRLCQPAIWFQLAQFRLTELSSAPSASAPSRWRQSSWTRCGGSRSVCSEIAANVAGAIGTGAARHFAPVSITKRFVLTLRSAS